MIPLPLRNDTSNENFISLPAQSSSVQWDWLDELPLTPSIGRGTTMDGDATSITLKGTDLSCISVKAGKWENRVAFIKKVVEDALLNCPKDEPFALVSLGSSRLLTEFLIGKALIENGFCKISFFLIDPGYIFSEPVELQSIEKVLSDFRTQIGSVYSATWKEPFPEKQIHFLARAQNISTYFPTRGNVIVIESLPPYTQPLNYIKKWGLEQKPEDFLIGSRFVPPDQANAIAFLPKTCIKHYRKQGGTLSTLPTVVFQSQPSKSYYCLDWGCKIQTDGSYLVNFFGAEGFYSSLGISAQQKMALPNGDVISLDQWTPTTQRALENVLNKHIEALKQDNPLNELSQNEKSALLEKVKQTLADHMRDIEFFYLADYGVDRTEMLSFLSSHASHHYRKVFGLIADGEDACAITESNIH
jgi:hypothetical protein